MSEPEMEMSGNVEIFIFFALSRLEKSDTNNEVGFVKGIEASLKLSSCLLFDK